MPSQCTQAVGGLAVILIMQWGENYMRNHLAWLKKLSRNKWTRLLEGWRDGNGKRIVAEVDVEMLAWYMPLIVGVIISDREGFIWFPPEMTPEQCTQQQLQKYQSAGVVSNSWLALVNHLLPVALEHPDEDK